MPDIDAFNTKTWRQAGQLHREDGPAVITSYGMQAWYIYGKYHRIDGPAVMHSNGRLDWAVDGRICLNWAEFQKQSKISDEDLSILMLRYPNFDEITS